MPQSNNAVHLKSPLQKLPANKGGYYFLEVPSEIVQEFSKGKASRLVCNLDDAVALNCGLNHLGNGNYFIIIATRHIKTLKKTPGDIIKATIKESNDSLGVAVPEVLEALLSQDEDLNKIYNQMSDGKKRSLIFLIKNIKNIDLQVQKTISFLNAVKQNRSPYKRTSS
jgi:hypothetical protein